MPARYALYYAPAPDSPWWTFGARWLGRDPRGASAGPVSQSPAVHGVAPAEFAALTAAPRRYGFHATLKAPIALAEGASEAGLVAAIGRFCAAERAVSLPALEVTMLDDFLALTPSAPAAALQALAARIVEAFDPFRAPSPAATLARRRAKGLDAREDALLERWGYPYVFERYRFHMTLTGSLRGVAAPTITALRAAALAEFAAIGPSPPAVDAISLLVEPEAGGDFRFAGRFPFVAG